MDDLILIPLLLFILSIVLTILMRSKFEYGNVIGKYTEESSLGGTKYFVEIFQKLYVDGGSLESGRRIKILEISKKDYELLEIMDEIKVLKKTNKVVYHKFPKIISVDGVEKYFIDAFGDRMDIEDFKKRKVFIRYF